MLKNTIIISFLCLILIIIITVIYFYLPVKDLIIYNKSFEYITNKPPNGETIMTTNILWDRLGNGLSDSCRIGNYALFQGQYKYPLGPLYKTGLINVPQEHKASPEKYLEDINYKEECNDSGDQGGDENITKLLFNYLSKLKDIEYDMVNKSDKFKKSSCEVLSNDTFDKAYQCVNNSIYIIMNMMYLHGPFRIYDYLNSIYDNYSLLYRYINKNGIIKISNIDTVLVSNHHHAVEWIYRKYPDNTIPTIFHIDTHDDINPFFLEDQEDIYKYKKSINDNNTEEIKKFYNRVLNNDIGSVLVPAVYPYENNGGIIWLRPNWTHNRFKKNKDTYYSVIKANNTADEDNKNDKPRNAIGYNFMDDFILNENDVLDKNKSVVMSSFYLDQINDDFYNSFPNDYILNIDIDYFVTYGGTSYYDYREDPISYNRTSIDFRRSVKDPVYEVSVAKRLSYEINIIRKRIDYFLLIIKKLKENGKIPSFIILCNSTSIDKSKSYFLEPWENTDIYKEKIGLIETTNDYTPKYLTLWLQNTLLNHMHNIFNN